MVAEKCRIVLVIEDDHRVRQFIAEALTPIGYEVRCVPTVGSAAALLKSERPDVILLDLGLPDAAGTSTLDWLQTIRPGVPIVVATGNRDEELARRMLNAGASDYIGKPFSVERLAHAIATAIASRLEGDVHRDTV
jgi:two-component system, OmpR family, KDP operon response regulator KdpE